MNKILKIFLAMILVVSMMIEIIPANIVRAEEEVPVNESAETTETAEEKSEETEEPSATEETEAEEETLPAEVEEPAAEEEAPAAETEEETFEEEDELILNEEPFSGEFTVGDLTVIVSYEADTVPEGTEVVVSEASEEALAAIREKYGENAGVKAADISFVFGEEEVKPLKNVSVVLSYDGKVQPADIVHVKEELGEDGEVKYEAETVTAVVTPVTETIQVPVYEKEEITEKVNVPYEYKWTETVKKYKEVDVYGDVEVEYEEEVPVYETREITEERTEYVTKTRQVEKTRTVKVKVDFVWWNPLTWLGYKYVTEKYYVTETYKEPVTVTVVVGTEEVQVGTETVTKTRTERQVIGKETVEDGTEEVVRTETRYREEEVGIGQYELVLKGYKDETVTVSQTVSFKSKDFSVYAVVEPGSEDDEARATVKFYGLNDAVVATYYVKNSDIMPPTEGEKDPEESYIDDIVADPGVGGQIPTGQIFLGWYISDTKYDSASVTPMTIDKVRQYLVDLEISEGMEVKVWAVILKVFAVTYLDEQGISMGTDEIKILSSENSASYTVSKTYTPVDPTKAFEGWDTTDTSKISNAQYDGAAVSKPYKMGTTMTISGDIVFTAAAPKGNWLVFDENGKGATYNAPQFVKMGQNTIAPTLEMKRLGYTFGGWYTNPECTGEPFEFGHPITERTTIYAKWTEVSTATYVVLIWKQNVSGSGYDFVTSRTQDGATVNATITATNNNNNVTVSGGGKTFTYNGGTGFKYKSSDAGKTVSPQSNTVINVYFDRETVTFNFYVYRSRRWQIDQTMTGLYGSTLESNGYTWPTNYDWYLSYSGGSGSGTRRTFMDAFIPAGVSGMTHDFYAATPSGTATIHFYKQNEDLNGYTEANTVSVTANSRFTMSDKYNGFQLVSYSTNGTSYSTNIGTPDSQGYYNTVSYNYQLHIRYNRKVYNILFEDGVYVDGDNNPITDQPNLGQLKVVENIVYESDTTAYNKGQSKYYDPSTDHTLSGFVFEGWYIDDQCTSPYTFTTMPEGITVYAKWRQVQYRVFMHPNAKLPDGTNDSSLDWGDSAQPDDKKQSMNFRVDYMEQVSMPTGIRNEYEFIGWFTDEAGTVPYDLEAKLTDQNVITDYYKNDPKNYTDKMNKFGEIEGSGWNSDLTGWDDDGDTSTPGKERFWITKKLDLYGKWSEVLTGATGVGVIYDANGGSNAPTDTKKYKDNIDAVAGTAATPKTGERFLYWVVQKYNKETGKYEDTTTIVYPGASFTVHKSMAKETDLTPQDPDYEEGVVYKAYTMQLRAEYGPAEIVQDTFIDWYQNEKDETNPDAYKDPIHVSTGEDSTKGLAINEATPIYDLLTDSETEITIKRGHRFLGWARMPEYELGEDGKPIGEPKTYYKLTEADLFLKYDWNTGKYQAKVDNVWKNVTSIAADEKMPYHALYAVWEDVIYIVHGADNKVDVVPLNEALEREKLTTGYDAETGKYTSYYYGGYGLIADTEAADPSGFALTKGGSEATYSGTYEWKRTNAQKDGKAFTVSTDTTVASAKKRTVGDVFYIKEVPSTYLASPKVAYVYNPGYNAFTSICALSVVDTTIYRAGGVVTGNTHDKGTFASSFEMAQNNGASKTVDSSDLFNLSGYLTINDMDTAKGVTYSLTPFWITYDSITVDSNSSRQVTVGDNTVE